MELEKRSAQMLITLLYKNNEIIMQDKDVLNTLVFCPYVYASAGQDQKEKQSLCNRIVINTLRVTYLRSKDLYSGKLYTLMKEIKDK